MEAILFKQGNNNYEETFISSKEDLASENKKYKLIVKHLSLSWGYYDSSNKYIECHPDTETED